MWKFVLVVLFYAKCNIWFHGGLLVIKFHGNIIDLCEAKQTLAAIIQYYVANFRCFETVFFFFSFTLHVRNVCLSISVIFVSVQILSEWNKSPLDRCTHQFQWSASAVLRDLIFFIFGFVCCKLPLLYCVRVCTSCCGKLSSQPHTYESMKAKKKKIGIHVWTL